jgi:hypothetical protein
MNLKKHTTSILVLALFSVITGCFEAPNFPDTPSIDFENVEFKQGASIFDSLIISIHYEDGDGDLGLDQSFDNDPRYAPGSFVQFADQNFVSVKDIGTPLSGVPGFDVAPPFIRPYSCVNWVEAEFTNGVMDTLLYIPNEDNFNIFVKFMFRAIGSSQETPFEEFDWISSDELPACGSPIDGRFPVLKNTTDSSAPIEGVLRYGFVSTGLVDLFADREIKLEISIQDRKLQRSNTVIITGKKGDSSTQQGFTLAGIQTN